MQHRVVTQPISSRWTTGTIGAIVLTTLFGAIRANETHAQDDKTCYLLWSANRREAGSQDFGELRLRPNAPARPIYLSVRNPVDLVTTVVVELWADGEPVAGATSELRLGGQETKPIEFKLEAPPAPTKDPGDKASPAPAGDPKATWMDLKGPLEIRLYEKKGEGRELVGQAKTFTVDLAPSDDLVSISESDVSFTPASGTSKSKLRAKVTATDKVGSTPCEVALEVSPRFISGLKPQKPIGATRGNLAAGQSLELVAADLQFNEGAPATGYCCVWIDGRPGPVFAINFRNGGTRRVILPVVRLECDRFVQPGKFPVGVVVANAGNTAGLKTMVGIDRNKNGAYEADEEIALAGIVDKKIRFSPTSKDGALLFQATAKEWVYDFNMSDTVGDCTVRARLMRNDREERVLSTMGAETNEVVQTVVFDGTKPVDVKIEAPKKAQRGKPLAITARGRDDESKINKVQFFVGKPAGDKAPMGAELVDADAANPDRTVWRADVPLKPDQKLVELSVQFTNGVGLTEFDSIKIELVDAEPATTGNIKGTIVNRDNEGQPGTMVTLVDSDKKEKAKTKTDDKGMFEFKDLPPGTYIVNARRGASGNSGSGSAAVAAGKTTEIKIEIKRF